MDEGWIKLYRKSMSNPIMKDFTAWGIFCWILLKVDRRTGKMTLGRKWASKELELKESTFYKALKRLEKRYKVVVLVTKKVTIKYTEVTVCKWHLYQGGNKVSNNPVTIGEQSSNTYTRIENRELRSRFLFLKNKKDKNDSETREFIKLSQKLL